MVAEKMLENYTMSCKYKNDGCDGKHDLSGNAYFEHINNCDFRPVTCPSCSDGSGIRYAEYLNHLINAHGINGQPSPGGALEYNLDFTNLSGDRQKFVWPPYYYKYYKETFLLRVVGDSKVFATTISLIGSKHKATNYIASIKLHYPQGKYMEWRGYVGHFRDDPFDVAHKTGQGLVLPFRLIKNISTTSSTDNISEWSYSVDIMKLPHDGQEVGSYLSMKPHLSTEINPKRQEY